MFIGKKKDNFNPIEYMIKILEIKGNSVTKNDEVYNR